MLLIGATYIPSMDMGNLHIESNTISSSNTNGNIILNPNGSGNIQFPDLGTSNVPYLDASGYLASSSVTPSELGTLSGVTGSVRGIAQAATLTSKTIDADSNTISNIDNGEIKAAAGIALDKLAATTASRALVSDGSGFIGASATTSTELGYVSGVTSAIQTQINSLSAGSYSGTSNDRQNLGLSVSVAANAMTIALKQADGTTDPSSGTGAVKIGFRSTTTSSGAYSVVSSTAATSLVISSGSTLGSVNATPIDVYIYAINNAGTVELAATSTYYPDNQSGEYSTIAEGGAGAADTRTSLYSTTARSNIPMRLIGRIRTSQTTAGTWASTPTRLEIAPFDLDCTPDRSTGFGCIAVETAHMLIPSASSCSVNQEVGEWISSCSASASTATITFTSGRWGTAPVCSASWNGTGSDQIATCSGATTTTVSCAVYDTSAAALVNQDFTITCTGYR